MAQRKRLNESSPLLGSFAVASPNIHGQVSARKKIETPSVSDAASSGKRTEMHVNFFAPLCRNRNGICCCKTNLL